MQRWGYSAEGGKSLRGGIFCVGLSCGHSEDSHVDTEGTQVGPLSLVDNGELTPGRFRHRMHSVQSAYATHARTAHIDSAHSSRHGRLFGHRSNGQVPPASVFHTATTLPPRPAAPRHVALARRRPRTALLAFREVSTTYDPRCAFPTRPSVRPRPHMGAPALPAVAPENASARSD